MSTPRMFSAPLLSGIAAVRHGLFGREGGVSSGVYASLNAGPGSGDDPAAVNENRARIAASLGVAPDHLVSLHQVHSARAVRVDGPWTSERPQADALVTTTPGVALTALSADCAPVLLADAQAGVIGAAHAGWKGAVGGVLEACVAEMVRAGADPSRIVASVGPCIHQPSYEVGPDFHATFLDADADSAKFFTTGAIDRFQFDLPGYCLHRLARAGVGRAEALPLDTYADRAAFHSHRRNVHEKLGDYGRNCAAIVLTATSGGPAPCGGASKPDNSREDRMIVYGASVSPFVRKVLAFGMEKAVSLELKQMGLGAKDPEFIEASPFGKMPGFRDGDFAISDSSAIIAYIDTLHPQPNLIPTEAKARARTIWYDEFADTIMVGAMGKIFFNRIVSPKFLGRPGDEAVAAHAEQKEVPPILDYIESVLPPSGWFVEDRLTLADIAVASPFVNMRHVGIAPNAAKHPKLAAFVAKMHARPSFATWIEKETRFLG